MKLLRGLLLLIVLASCTPADPCTVDPNLPTCRANQAVAQSTIVAANADAEARVRQAEMKATQDKASLLDQALQAQANVKSTQAAISVKTTQDAVSAAATSASINAAATRSALELDALRSSLILTATLQAAQLHSQATLQALTGEANVRKATVEADAAGVQTWILFGLLMLVVATLSFGLAWYGRKTMSHVEHGVMLKASLKFYGTHNQHAVLLRPGKNGEVKALKIDALIGPNGSTDALNDTLALLDVPDQQKLLAYIDQSKRSSAVDIAAVTGLWPEYGEAPDAAPMPIETQIAGYRYELIASNDTPPLLLAAPETVEVLDAEWRRVYAD